MHLSNDAQSHAKFLGYFILFHTLFMNAPGGDFG